MVSAFASFEERKEKCLHVSEENHPITKGGEEYSEASKGEIIFVIDPLTGLHAIFWQMLASPEHTKYCVYEREADIR